MNPIKLTRQQQTLLIASRVSAKSKNNSPKHVARFIAAVKARELV